MADRNSIVPLITGGISLTIAQMAALMATSAPFHRVINIGDETTNITTGTAKYTIMNPAKEIWTNLTAFITTPGTSTPTKVDVKVGGTSIFDSTNILQIDTTESSTDTSSAPAVFAGSVTEFPVARHAVVTIDITAIPTAGKGLKLIITGYLDPSA